MKKSLFLCGFYLVSLSAVAGVTAQFSPPVITQGQSVELRISSDRPLSGSPDFSILKKDFVLGGQGTVQNTSLVNGVMTTQYSIMVNLIPLKSGDITVPSLIWGKEKTNPVTLIVHPASSSATLGGQQDLFIRAEVTPKEVFEGQEIIYTVSLFDRAGLTEGDFSAPSLEWAELQPVGDDKMNSVEEKGKIYRQLTRQFVLFPSKEGRFVIPPVSFRGLISQQQRGVSSNMFPFGFDENLIFPGIPSNTREVFVQTDPVSITVRPRPGFMKRKWWFPSSNVKISETFSPSTNNIRVGEAITRKVTIIAKGTPVNRIPELTMSASADFKVYPDNGKKENYTDGNGISGLLEQSFVIVPMKSGTVVIPPLSIEWFDVTTNQERKNKVDGVALNVLENPAVTPLPLITAPAQTLSLSQEDATQKTVLLENPYAKENNLLFFAIGLTGGIFVAGLAFFIVRRSLKKKKQPIPPLYPY